VSVVPGGAEQLIADGGQITITQSAISLESLLGRFIFSMTEGQGSQGGAGRGQNEGGTTNPR
jgi:phospholipid/cholesterol/gamma-HCH transport system substrate-binding protein